MLSALDGVARIVHDLQGDTVTVLVWVDGARSDGEAYAETLDRIRSADPSEQVTMARVVRRLGRITGARPVPDTASAPVPDWLADTLVGQAGRDGLAVAAMDATTAFEAWTRHLESDPQDAKR